MNERELIDYLRGFLKKPPYLKTWLDEDCEIIELSEKTLLISVDTSSEGMDFPSEAPPQEIGYFSASLGLSDIAACGGDPLGILVSVSIPRTFDNKVVEIYEGVNQAALEAGTFILGGDTNAGVSELSLSVVSIGLAKPNRVLRRHQANKGDLVAVSGILDRYNFGYSQYTNKEKVDFNRMLRQPAPIRLGKILSNLKGVTSCIDLPDGLIKGLCDTSPLNLGFLIDDASLPVDYYRERIKIKDIPNYILASQPGGDLELLFTVSSSKSSSLERTLENEGISLHWIGEVTSEPGIKIQLDKEIVPPTVTGFSHNFRESRLFT